MGLRRQARRAHRQTGTASDGTVYAITVDGEKFNATVTPAGGKPTTLAEGVSMGAAYSACMKFAKTLAKAEVA